ncbi:hypothetical protein A9Q78_04455 [Methylophaga sp. 41_12_T18]|nr:hypothetical protein A9Q78_04455 [Methylophaga sp. 41_12_T18]
MTKYLCLIAVLTCCVSACSDETQKVEDSHVWQEQTDMIDEAKGIEKLINDAALQKKQQFEQDSH